MVGTKVAPSVLAHLSSFSPGSTGRSIGRDYQEIRNIGRGSFGEATLAKDSAGNLCVVKTVDISKLGKEQQADAVNEVKVLSSLKHPYIVGYHESFIENGTLAIVMDYAQGGDLAKRIACQRDKGGQLFAEGQILRWFTQIALGLKYLHNKHILHRDLKPQNIFLTKQDDLRLGDFGISKVLGSGSLKEETTIGTPYYFSPEICREKLYSFASDIWALGCMVYELMALQVPFKAPNLPCLVRMITTGRLPAVPPQFSNDLRLLCNELLCRDHMRRPSAKDLLEGPMIQAELRQMLQDPKYNQMNADANASPPLGKAGVLDPERRTLGSLGSLLKPLAPGMEMKRSPSAPVRTLRQPSVSSNVLTSSSGGLKTAWPNLLSKEGVCGFDKVGNSKMKKPCAFPLPEKDADGPGGDVWSNLLTKEGVRAQSTSKVKKPSSPLLEKTAQKFVVSDLFQKEITLGPGGGCDKLSGNSKLRKPCASSTLLERTAWADTDAVKEGCDKDSAISKEKRPCASPLLGMGACCRSTSRGQRHASRRRPALPVWQDLH